MVSYMFRRPKKRKELSGGIIDPALADRQRRLRDALDNFSKSERLRKTDKPAGEEKTKFAEDVKNATSKERARALKRD